MLLQTASAATAITGCTTITTPGEYYMTGDIITGPIRKCIDIQADNVTFDCKGYMLYDPANYSIQGKLTTVISAAVYSEMENSTVKNCEIKMWDYAIEFHNTNNAAIHNNEIYHNKMTGVLFTGSTNTKIYDNEIYYHLFGYGIKFWQTNQGHIYNNEIHHNTLDGIFVGESNNNDIEYNTIYNNMQGIKFQSSSDNNEVNDNKVSYNAFKGVYLTSNCNSNLIFNNIFANNTCNAIDTGSNSWNTTNSTGPNIIGGPYIGGNYFSDYPYPDTDGDGFGEIPHNISGGDNIDFLPLTIIPEFPVMFLSVGLMFLSLFARRKDYLNG